MQMREVLGKKLADLMKENQNIVVIDADLSKANGTYHLRENFPDRVLDVGVAEQNMASIAAGMSSYGFIPFICTFAPFATRRICDQIAVSICYAKQNVKIIGTDPGIGAEINGGTHMSFEDIAVLRSIANMVIFEPTDEIHLEKTLPQIVEHNGPVYMRVFRKQASVIFSDDDNFSLFSSKKIKDGNDISCFCSGLMVSETLKADRILEKFGISAEIINIHTIKPLDEEAILNSVRKTKAVITVENHNIIGGLGSAVSELLIKNYPVKLKSVGVTDKFGQVGKIQDLKIAYQMDKNDIVRAALELLGVKDCKY
ncbi:MAG: transketolase family protein [Oscillospiraceae bacterium]|jgi:transketolase|nr:transketolase family protein [Oscillospiraceae bacterium]